MSQPYIAQITIMPYTFVPAGWAGCNGQIIAIAQQSALFAVIGTFFGGNGTSTFGLPNLQQRAPVGTGTAPGLSPWAIGEAWGTATVGLTADQIPAHTHNVLQEQELSESPSPMNNALGTLTLVPNGVQTPLYKQPPSTFDLTLSPSSLATAGNSQPHENRQPFLAMQFCIAMEGIYPSRN